MHNRNQIIAIIVTALVLAALWPGVSAAATAKSKYMVADSCYQKLLKSTKRQKYRDNWLRCIRKFEAVHRHDPSGPWAAAGLYMSGRLYAELYRHQFRDSTGPA